MEPYGFREEHFVALVITGLALAALGAGYMRLRKWARSRYEVNVGSTWKNSLKEGWDGFKKNLILFYVLLGLVFLSRAWTALYFYRSSQAAVRNEQHGPYIIYDSPEVKEGLALFKDIWNSVNIIFEDAVTNMFVPRYLTGLTMVAIILFALFGLHKLKKYIVVPDLIVTITVVDVSLCLVIYFASLFDHWIWVLFNIDLYIVNWFSNWFTDLPYAVVSLMFLLMFGWWVTGLLGIVFSFVHASHTDGHFNLPSAFEKLFSLIWPLFLIVLFFQFRFSYYSFNLKPVSFHLSYLIPQIMGTLSWILKCIFLFTAFFLYFKGDNLINSLRNVLICFAGYFKSVYIGVLGFFLALVFIQWPLMAFVHKIIEMPNNPAEISLYQNILNSLILFFDGTASAFLSLLFLWTASHFVMNLDIREKESPAPEQVPAAG